MKERLTDAKTQTLPGKNPTRAFDCRLFASGQVGDYTLRLNWEGADTDAISDVNGLTVCAGGGGARTPPTTASTPSPPSRAASQGTVFIPSPPPLVYIESSGARCAVTPLALDGQIPEEMQECGLDTTREH